MIFLPVPPRPGYLGKGLSCDFKGDIIDPDVIATVYKTGGSKGGTTLTSQGVAAFEDAEFKQTDVDAFQKAYNLPHVNISVLGPNSGGFFGEAGLDTQYITSSGRGVPTWFLSQEEFNLLTWCELVEKMPAPPMVLSISWGGGESNYDLTRQHAANSCFQKLGLQGISIFASSGDDGTGKQGFLCKKFDPTWPASSPYLTAVGATYLQSGTENGWSYSGGGFSQNFPLPKYQDVRVAAYLNSSTLPPAKLFNSSGRATPDVSALGTCYTVFSGGVAVGTLSGTSASTPTFAGLVSVIVDMRVSQKKSPLGFLNPTLYAATAIGFDPVTGNNKDGGCPAGFAAQSGWDPVTGLGTPDFQLLKQVLRA